MNSEKVKGIKKGLECCANIKEKCDNKKCYLFDKLEYHYCERQLKTDILTLINELESENDTLHTNLCEYRRENKELKEIVLNKAIIDKKVGEMVLQNQQLKDRIAELEKENDDYYERCVILRRENEQLKTLVGSLEKKNIDLEEYIKGNEQDTKAFVNGWHKDLETELKQFAERLKEKFCYVFGNEYEQSVSGFDTKVLIEHIDETLKEFI